MQATIGEDHAVLDQDAEAAAEAAEEVGAAAEEGREEGEETRREGPGRRQARQPDREGIVGATQEGNLRRYLQLFVSFVLLQSSSIWNFFILFYTFIFIRNL